MKSYFATTLPLLYFLWTRLKAVELQNVWRWLFEALRDRGGDFSTTITLPRLNLSHRLQQRVIEFDVFSWIIQPGSYPAHLYFFCHLHRMLDRQGTLCRRQRCSCLLFSVEARGWFTFTKNWRICLYHPEGTSIPFLVRQAAPEY